MWFDSTQLFSAILVAGAFASVSLLFSLADFSFGYFVGFYFYTMVLGYLWLNCFSDLSYNHQLAGLSAAASAVAFLLPALFISSPIRQVYALSARALQHLLRFILLVTLVTIVVGAVYNFRLVALENIYNFRLDLEFPKIVLYLMGITSTALMPFAFACFLARRERWRAGAVLVLLLLFYPITLTKVAFFTPAWLIAMALLSKIFEAKISVVLSLLLPILAGVLLVVIFKQQGAAYFTIVNFRMIAIPSNAMDIYNDFFSRSPLTFFCQISVLKSVVSCPYQEQLSVVLQQAYGLGNYNASLFATEGIASVGPLFAPATVFLCGLVIALGNRLSAGLPPRFILTSGAVFPQFLLNVPLSAVLLTYGLATLFLLWYLVPREMFEQKAIE